MKKKHSKNKYETKVTFSKIRLLVFFLCLALFLSEKTGFIPANLPAAVSPFLFLTAWLGGLFFSGAAFFALAIILVCLLKKRFFCRYLCPMGCSFALINKGVRRFKLKRKFKNENIGQTFTGQKTADGFPAVSQAIAEDPPVSWSFWGKVFVLLTFLFLFLKIPGMTGFQFLDPLILFGALFRIDHPLFFLSAVLLVFASSGFWCVNFCPLGALQDMIRFCGKSISNLASSREQKKISSDCIKESETSVLSTGKKLRRRRAFLLLIPFAFVLEAVRRSSSKIVKRIPFFRPPGSCGDPKFTGLCASCGRCIAVCPTKHLITIAQLKREESAKTPALPSEEAAGSGNPQVFGGASSIDRQSDKTEWRETFCKSSLTAGISAFELTPVIETKKTFCDAKCNSCSRVCPTGAIRRFSIEEKKMIHTAIVKYEFENCVLYDSKDCNICVRECPYEAIGLVWNEELYVNVPTVDAEKCTGCGRCIVFCPGFDPIWQGDEEDETDDNSSDHNNKSDDHQSVCDPPKAFTLVSRQEWEAMSSSDKN